MSSKRTPPFPEYPTWSEAKFFGFLRSTLRRAWMRWPPRYEVLRQASVPYNGPDKRRKKSVQCAKCGEFYKGSEIQIDHKIACGSLKSFDDLPQFVSRLFVGVDKLDALCKGCHAVKTREERDGQR